MQFVLQILDVFNCMSIARLELPGLAPTDIAFTASTDDDGDLDLYFLPLHLPIVFKIASTSTILQAILGKSNMFATEHKLWQRQELHGFASDASVADYGKSTQTSWNSALFSLVVYHYIKLNNTDAETMLECATYFAKWLRNLEQGRTKLLCACRLSYM